MLTSLDTTLFSYCRVDILLIAGKFELYADVALEQGIRSLHSDQSFTYDELLQLISDYILSWNPPRAFTVDGVNFPTRMPLKYLHTALKLFQSQGSLPEDFKQRVIKLSEEYFYV